MTDLEKSLPPIGNHKLSETVFGRLRALILDGTWSAGSRLPTEHELAATLKVSRGTVRQALRSLQAGGLITSRPGLGTFVRNRSGVMKNNLNINSSLTQLIASLGLVPGCRHVSCRLEMCGQLVAEALSLPLNSPTCVIERVRTAQDKPVAFTIDIVPSRVLDISGRTITLQELEGLFWKESSIYKILDAYLARPIGDAVATICPVIATPKFQHILEVPRETPLLFIEQVAYDRGHDPLVYSHQYHIPSFFAFTIYRTP